MVFWEGSRNKNRYHITKLMLAQGFGILAGSKNENRYHITKLILCTGFWDSGKAAKTKIDIVLLS